VSLSVFAIPSNKTRSFFDPYGAGDIGLWRWLAYCGAVLVLAAMLNAAVTRYERFSVPWRTVLNLGSVVGQCSLLVFVLHTLVRHVKALLDATGLPEKVTLTVPLLMFVVICGWVMSKIYRLYYGQLRHKHGLTAIASSETQRREFAT
jgi:uncharacterized membrane protein (DUF485 family)